MKLIVDFHLHSHFSRATSASSNLEGLYKWGKIKGINVLGTGDFTHPGWFQEIQQKLEPAEPGLFQLKEQYRQEVDRSLPSSVKNNTLRFLLSVEISNIYSKFGRVRKIHNIILAPSLKAASSLNAKLSRIGNLQADGRPILGLDSQDLLKITLETDPDILFVPAHIWTPWFALFGSNSGFDSLEEAFGELTSNIKVIETGLSSDPFMNWRLSQLDRITITSNSDAHSPQKLGREATILDCDLNYFEIINALKSNDQRVVGTIEFFPEEGKYHFDGHKRCNIRLSPQETKKYQGICPKCGQPLTLGVAYRVEQLADRPIDYRPQQHKSVEYIIPLPEILADIKNTTPTSRAVIQLYTKLYSTLGDEFTILRSLPLEAISQAGFSEVAEAIGKMRKGDVKIEPGYDGVYGVIKVNLDKSLQGSKNKQLSLI